MNTTQRFIRRLQWSGLIPALVLLLGMAAPSVRAGVVTETKNFAGSSSLINTLTLPHFDDALGILSSVKVSYIMDMNATGIVQLGCPQTRTNPCSILATFSLSMVSPVMEIGSIALLPNKTTSFTVACEVDPGDFDTCTRQASIHAEGSDVADDLATLQLFDGPDDLVFNFKANTSGFVADIYTSGWAIIEYTYDERVTVPVAEPGTLAVASLALLALAGTARRLRGRADLARPVA